MLAGPQRRTTPAALAAGVLLASLGCASQRASLGRDLHFAKLYFEGPSPKSECGDAGRFRWCVYDPPRGRAEDSDTLLYFLHYGSGDEKTFGGPLGRSFYAECAKGGLTPPRVVSVSFAPYWILADRPGGRFPTPTFDEFVRDWMPKLERGRPPARRLLWGVSQGGFNAALLALRQPDLWKAAALTCPAIPAISPFSSAAEKKAYAAARGLDEGGVDYGLALFTDRLDGPADFAPLDVVALASKSKAPRTLIQANLADEYGFYEGAERLGEALKAAGAPVRFQAEPGAHCVDDVGPVAEFLARTP